MRPRSGLYSIRVRGDLYKFDDARTAPTGDDPATRGRLVRFRLSVARHDPVCGRRRMSGQTNRTSALHRSVGVMAGAMGVDFSAPCLETRSSLTPSEHDAG